MFALECVSAEWLPGVILKASLFYLTIALLRGYSEALQNVLFQLPYLTNLTFYLFCYVISIAFLSLLCSKVKVAEVPYLCQ